MYSIHNENTIHIVLVFFYYPKHKSRAKLQKKNNIYNFFSFFSVKTHKIFLISKNCSIFAFGFSSESKYSMNQNTLSLLARRKALMQELMMLDEQLIDLIVK